MQATRPRATTAPSVLIAANDAEQVRNLVEALSRSDRLPAELILAWGGNGDPPSVVEEAPCAVHAFKPADPEAAPSQIHNELARAAHAEKLIFLGPDCVPGRTLVAAYERRLDHIDAVVRGASGPGMNLGVRKRTLLTRIGGFEEACEPGEEVSSLGSSARIAEVPVRDL